MTSHYLYNGFMKKGVKYPELQRARIGNCIVCGKEYRAVNDFKTRKQKYCSKECWSIRGSKKNIHTCLHCKKEFNRYGPAKYCSRACSHSAMIGEKATRWIDGKSLERDRARLGTELKEWRKKVYERDGFSCMKCGYKGKELNAHHIIHWAKDETKRFDIDNGITLCIDCHGKEHGIDFTKKPKNKCPDCGKQISKQSKRCRKCGTINQWKNQKNTAMSL